MMPTKRAPAEEIYLEEVEHVKLDSQDQLRLTFLPARLSEVPGFEACRFDPRRKSRRYSSNGAFINRSTVDTVL
jgi:hypothetical protein